ncbi:MAG: metallophosphoesterase [Nanoarchaeota archaeon]|nr:metallophosphoesterase [Nanoarchaeota archaeon]MBU1004713.1 metallophosphoesterase [Nanoarchaeota archaeon]MBU1945759.1 metallophosphoesterase [Nanoarchaeota archaeon]
MIGVISDTHDNVSNVIKSIKIFENAEVDFIMHCGDIISPATARFFRGIHTKAVKGNCDGDVENLKKAFEDIHGEFFEDICEMDISGKKILAYHGQDTLRLQSFVDNQGYDYILTGHTHKCRDEKIGKTRIINPGSHYYGGENKVVLLDVINDKVDFIEVN